jgi:DNA replicative helicase MCM subunit Mcm2 (Cdc46/Mcm family)
MFSKGGAEMKQWRKLLEDNCAEQIHMHATEADCISSITIPFALVEEYPELRYSLSEKPLKTMAAGDEVLFNMIEDLNGSLRARIRVIGLPETCAIDINSLRTRDRNRLLRIDVNVLDVNHNSGWIKKIDWHCLECRAVNHTLQNFLRSRIKPWKCCDCGKIRNRSTDFALDSESTSYEDCQQILIVDANEENEGQRRVIDAWLFDELVGSVQKGDVIRINARLRLASTHPSGDFDATTLRTFQLQIESYEMLEPHEFNVEDQRNDEDE